MAPARPLHELLAGLTGDPTRAPVDREAYLADNGHPDLPEDLVAEAVVSYADTAPVEVAEHLAPFVTTHSAVPTDEPPAEGWFDLLASAPAEPPIDLDSEPDTADPSDATALPDDPGPALDFGLGAPDLTADPSTMDEPAKPPATEEPPPTDHDPTPAPSWPDLEPEPVDLDAEPEPDDTPDADPLD